MKTTALNPAIAHIPMPDRIRDLPVGPNGFPVPYFVAWLDADTPEFRCMDGRKIRLCIEETRCWVCGGIMGKHKPRAFVIGPMCSVTRTSAEPPSHRDCAMYSVRACPFLSRPHMERRDNALPEGTVDAPGYMIRRNPGCSAVWTTYSYKLMREGDGVLFQIGDPDAVSWWAEGRTATRAEVVDSINSGLPLLVSEAERNNPIAMAQLRRLINVASTFLPDAQPKGD